MSDYLMALLKSINFLLKVKQLRGLCFASFHQLSQYFFLIFDFLKQSYVDCSHFFQAKTSLIPSSARVLSYQRCSNFESLCGLLLRLTVRKTS